MNNSAVDYAAEPWASRGCKSWQASYNSVGRDYVQHAAPAQPQSGPPALWGTGRCPHRPRRGRAARPPARPGRPPRRRGTAAAASALAGRAADGRPPAPDLPGAPWP